MRADGPQIRKRRQRKGYGLRALARHAQLSPSHLSRIERGTRNPQPEVMARIATALDCDMADIEPRDEGENT